jgi:hypothetical protein
MILLLYVATILRMETIQLFVKIFSRMQRSLKAKFITTMDSKISNYL